MAGHLVLVQRIGVRIPIPEPKIFRIQMKKELISDKEYSRLLRKKVITEEESILIDQKSDDLERLDDLRTAQWEKDMVEKEKSDKTTQWVILIIIIGIIFWIFVSNIKHPMSDEEYEYRMNSYQGR